jgi:hypothetical protein
MRSQVVDMDRGIPEIEPPLARRVFNVEPQAAAQCGIAAIRTELASTRHMYSFSRIEASGPGGNASPS